MLIVSQDGSQVIGVDENNIKLYVNDCDILIDDLPCSFGTYPSQEKALEIVEEICKVIRENGLFNDYSDGGTMNYTKCYVLRMPNKEAAECAFVFKWGIEKR